MYIVRRVMQEGLCEKGYARRVTLLRKCYSMREKDYARRVSMQREGL